MNKGYDSYYLGTLIFGKYPPPQLKELVTMLGFAIRDNDPQAFQDLADIFFEVGSTKWGNHLERIAKGIHRQQERRRKANERQYLRVNN